MADWSRIQRLEMDLANAHAVIRRQLDHITDLGNVILDERDARHTATRERDTARAVAVRLEQENAGPIDELETALAAAVQRVEALPSWEGMAWERCRVEAIAAIRGGS